ncbi:hypothetical protein ACUXAV_002558 [Cupriavidus metallidurans]|nr:hypothetical protein [Cupriavidus metallidurans]MDE4920787.1 hypothetical protein [Cupriavidus metallidurans]QGS32917.1 hypothetical protein FOB83_29440 [Cupriavidus metallidurans]UBM07467.1 hypothetical protein LAI70_06950 [Cupriavidus metallidurans]
MLQRIRYMAMATGRVAARKALHFCNTSRHTTGSHSPKWARNDYEPHPVAGGSQFACFRHCSGCFAEFPGERRHRHRLRVNDEAPRELAPNP